jgi:arginine-tRNA-protein transferase
MAVSVVDCFADAWSSVYCFYEPEEPRRSLGTFMALAEIEAARAAGARWLYLGFYIRGCSKMTYKARFAPGELQVDGQWHAYDPSTPDNPLHE